MRAWNRTSVRLGSGMGLAALVVALSAAGCADQVGGEIGDRGPGLVPAGSADGFENQMTIPLTLGETVEGQAGGTAFTLYVMELHRATTVRARLDRISGDLAPMAFLYADLQDLARPDGFLRPASYDYDDSYLEIEWAIDRGGSHYLVVRAYGETSGDFRLTLTGTEVTGAPLTDEEAQQVADSLDNICPDTFCGGDINFRVDSLSCDGAGRCDVGMRAQTYYEEDAWPADVLEGREESEVFAAGSGGYGGSYEARLTGTESDEDGVWVEVACGLVGELYTFEDIAESHSWGLRHSERLYDQLLDCVDAVEGLLYAL